MSQIDKLIKKFSSLPKSVKYKELDKILRHLGFKLLNTKGSHKKYKHRGLSNDIIIPVHNNECKDFYKMQTYKLIKNILKKHEN